MEWGWKETAILALGIIAGAVGATYYFRRYRKRAVELIDKYKRRADRLERAWKHEPPGPIEKG